VPDQRRKCGESSGSIGHAERVTPDIGSLVPAGAADGGDWHSTAIIGGPWENDGSMAFGFFELADAAVERWKAGNRNDAIVIPIIYNYRHGIELALKAEIREAAECLRRGGVTGPHVDTDEVDHWMSATHSIEQLVNRLTRLLQELQLGPGQEIPAETLEVLGKLHVLDQHGQAFRYSAASLGVQRSLIGYSRIVAGRNGCLWLLIVQQVSCTCRCKQSLAQRAGGPSALLSPTRFDGHPDPSKRDNLSSVRIFVH
jgi:hypothetical protein